MGFEFDVSPEDIRVFLDEAEDLLQVMESSILNLEKDGHNPEHLQEIFRAAHTLKGSSATLGHRNMAEVTHAMENVLDKLRKGKLTVSTAVVDTLFACLDVLVAYKDEIATGEASGVEPAEILQRLTAIDEAAPRGAGEGSPKAGAVNTAETAPAAALELTADEAERLAKAVREGWSAYVVRVALDKNAPMPAVRAFQTLLALGDLGKVLRSWPTEQEVEEDKVGDEVKAVVLTRAASAELRAAVEAVPEVKLEELSPLGAPEAPNAVASEAAAAVQEAKPRASGTEQPKQEGGGSGGTPRSSKLSSRTVRVDVDVLDNLMSLVGELVIERTRMTQVLNHLESEREGDELAQIMASALTNMGRMTSNLQDEIQRARMLPVDNLFRKFPRMVRDVAQKAGKEIEFVVLGEETELDRSVIEEIGDPLMHLLRNAIDHGIEPPQERIRLGKPAKGTVTLEAYHEENHIIISIRDDGRGMDPEKIRASAVRKGLISEDAARRMPDAEVISLVWRPGFSTAEKVSDISGRGVGLDVVHKNIEKLNGSVEIRSEVGKGTEFRVKLPLTLAIIRALQVEVLGATYCLPLASVVETDRIPVAEIQQVRQRAVIVKRGEVIPLLWLIDAFKLERPDGYQESEEIFVVIVSVLGKQIGLVVDSLIGESEVVIKPLGKFIGDVPGISGATILGDGNVALILDISSLINTVQADLNRSAAVQG